MALRLAATGRQAVLDGGLSDLFASTGLEVVFRTGAVPADVDTVSANSIIATLIDASEPSYGAASDDATTATVDIDANLQGNAVADHDYADGGDGAGIAEIFVGPGRTAGDKVGDFTVGGPSTTGTQDFNWTGSDTIANGGLLTISSLAFTKT